MTQAIEKSGLYDNLQNPIDAIDRLGEWFAKSGMFGCDKFEQGKVLAAVCIAERKSPVAIMREYHIVEGKLSKKALAALAEFRTQHGGKSQWLRTGDEPGEGANRYAEATFTTRDGQSLTYRYSLADAQSEGLIRKGSRWEKRPGNMLRARVISNALGMLCPEIYAGGDVEYDDAPASTTEINLAGQTSQPAASRQSTQTTDQAPACTGSVDTAATSSNLPSATKVSSASGFHTDGMKGGGGSNTPQPAQNNEQANPAPTGGAAAPIEVESTVTREGGLDDATVQKLEEIMGSDAQQCVEFLIAKGKLRKGEPLSCVPADYAAKIIGSPAKFIEFVKRSGGVK